MCDADDKLSRKYALLRIKPLFLVRRMPVILSSVPDAEVRYAGCHVQSKLDSDVMN